uniref:Uncharacterized protein n=1 Tax=Solanum lycopersicum TaxID=4081 RepID=A0A3Q7HBF2_SOLLC
MEVNFGFEISTLEANAETTKWMLVDIEDILGHFIKSKPIIVQEDGKNVMILKLHKRTIKFIYGNISSYGINSVSLFRDKNNEKQFIICLVTLSTLIKGLK